MISIKENILLVVMAFSAEPIWNTLILNTNQLMISDNIKLCIIWIAVNYICMLIGIMLARWEKLQLDKCQTQTI